MLKKYMMWEFFGLTGMLLYFLILMLGVSLQKGWLILFGIPVIAGMIVCHVAKYIYAFKIWRSL